MQTVRQTFTILKQNPLLSTISILGTAFAITMIMAIVIIWQTKYADLEPEVNRSRCLYFSAMHISSKIEEGVQRLLWFVLLWHGNCLVRQMRWDSSYC